MYSHSDAEANGKIESFKFKTGDVISFEYHPAKGKLRMIKDKEQYELDVEIGKGERYAVCAYIYRSGNSIEFVS